MAGSTHWRRVASSPLHLLRHELNRLLEDHLRPEGFAGSEPPPTDLDPTAWSPAIDVFETATEVLVLVEVPGVDPGSIDLAVDGDCLTLRGSKEPGELPDTVAHVRERRFGAFHRHVRLPAEVDADKAQAEATSGVLKIRLPKRTAAKPRTIPIQPS
jgi:HSP20 family protein